MLNFNYKNSLHTSIMGVIEHSERNAQPRLIATTFKIKNNQILLDASSIYETIPELSSPILQKKGIHLVITNQQVLTKTVKAIGNDQEILSQGYPNLNLETFYYEILKTPEKAFITLCRKQYINELISQYQEHNITITQLSLGGLNLYALPSYIQANPIRSFAILASFDDTTAVESLTATDDNQGVDYTIDGNTVSSQNTLALATILLEFTSKTISGNLHARNLELSDQYRKAKLFSKILYGGIGSLLLLLLINFFLFNAGYNKQQQLMIALETHKDQTEDLRQYKELIASKEAVVSSIIASGFSKTSFFMNQILESQPASITLTTLSYQPINKNINAKKPILIDPNLIKIEGNSIDKQDFSDWLTTIDQLPFIDFVTILSYGQVKNNISSFEINLSLQENDSTK